MITCYTDFDITRIKIKKPLQLLNKQIFTIYLDDDNPFYIQSPKCILAYNCVVYDNMNMYMDLIIDNDIFIEFLKKIHDKIVSVIKKRYDFDINKNIFIKKLDITERDINKYQMRIRNDNINCVKSFNANREILNTRSLSKDDKVICIFQVEKFIITSEYSILYFKVHQIKKCCNNIFDTIESCMIEDEEDDKIIIDKFVKMKQVGVPVECIKHKMLLENIRPDLINKILDVKKKNGNGSGPGPPPPAPPPPPPPPPMGLLKNLSIKKDMPFLGDIKSGNFKLNKISDKQRVERPIPESKLTKIMNLVDKDKKQFAASLDDILNAKKKLKKI